MLENSLKLYKILKHDRLPSVILNLSKKQISKHTDFYYFIDAGIGKPM